MSSSPACSFSSTQQVSPFIRLYGDVYNSCAKFLSLREVDALSKTCIRFRDLTVDVRRRVTDLDLGDFELKNQGLAQALKIHPRITRLRLVAPNLTPLGVRALAHTLQERALKCIVLSDCSFRGADLNFLIQQVNVTALEQLHLSKFRPLTGFRIFGGHPLDAFERVCLNSFCLQLKLSQSLTSLDLSSLSRFRDVGSTDLFLESLPETLEQFGPWPIQWSDEQMDFLIKNFPFQNIRRGDFQIGKLSPKKAIELIRLLPLSQMTHVRIVTQYDVQVVDENVFEALCAKLIECEKLSSLNVPLSLAQSTRLIPLLPARMTEIPQLRLNEQGVDCLVTKDLSRIESCQLDGWGNFHSEEKTRNLLEILPLTTMSQVHLTMSSQSLTQNNFAYLSDQLRQNKVLKSLQLHGDVEIDTVINLLDSLSSKKLHSLTIFGLDIPERQNSPKDIDSDQTSLIAYLRSNLHRWPHIKILFVTANNDGAHASLDSIAKD